MTHNSQRRADPSSISGSYEFTAADVEAAFAVADPDEQLFFDIFGPDWRTKPISVQLHLLARLAELNEQAASLGVTLAAPEPK